MSAAIFWSLADVAREIGLEALRQLLGAEDRGALDTHSAQDEGACNAYAGFRW